MANGHLFFDIYGNLLSNLVLSFGGLGEFLALRSDPRFE
ncbi:hypothetical protein D082_02090 [Synechocystis sp. PCC 6714]|nr:hypothetical protein D082_02090 [Synechocystis sp. PCC 6714]